MNTRRLIAASQGIAVILLLMGALLALCIGILALLVPEFSTGLERAWREYSASNLQVNSSVYGLRPLLDTGLLLGSYLFVSFALWSGRLIASKVANRSHFSK